MSTTTDRAGPEDLSEAEQVAIALGRDDQVSRKAALDLIQDLRHRAASTFTPAYSGSLGQARCDSFFEAYEALRLMPPATGEAPASTSDADGDLARLSAATKAECVLLAGSIRQDFGKLADAHGDLADDLDDTCDRIVDRMLAFLAARKLPAALSTTPAVADITQRRCAGIRKAWEAGSWPDEGGISFLLRHAEARVADLVSRSAPPQAAPAQGGVTEGYWLAPVILPRAMKDAVGRMVDDFSRDHARLFTVDIWNTLRAAAPHPPATEAAPSPAGMAEDEGWISVSERLPGEQGQDSEEVLVFLSGHCAMTDMACRQGAGWGHRFGFFDAERQCFRTHGRPDASVTHWRPLPTPPASTEA